MANRLELGGVDELLDELGTLPADLRAEGQAIVARGAARARDRIVSAYHRVTGLLQAGVQIFTRTSAEPYKVHHRVVTTAYYAHIYEFGSYRSRANPTFLPIVNEEQTASVKDVVELVKAKGLTVTGVVS